MPMFVRLLLALSLSQAADSAATGTLTGRVITDGTNAPVAGAHVMLMPAMRPNGPMGIPPQWPQTLTGSDGRYTFNKVAPGEYRIDVQKTGFAPLFDPTVPSPTLTVAAGQSLNGVDFRLQRGGVITGRVLDSTGEPLTDAHVMAMRRAPAGRPERPPIPARMQGPQQTNDVGEFRIAGLAPGEYLLAAVPRGTSPFGGPGISPAAASTAKTTLATTYYPGTIDQAGAQVITVSAGAEIGNIVFTMQTTPAFRVSGIVVDENGSPIAHAMIMLMGDQR